MTGHVDGWPARDEDEGSREGEGVREGGSEDGSVAGREGAEGVNGDVGNSLAGAKMLGEGDARSAVFVARNLDAN